MGEVGRVDDAVGELVAEAVEAGPVGVDGGAQVPGGLVGLLALQPLPQRRGGQGDQDRLGDEVVQRLGQTVKAPAAAGLLVAAVARLPLAMAPDDRRPPHDGVAAAAAQDPRQQQPPGAPGLAAAAVQDGR